MPLFCSLIIPVLEAAKYAILFWKSNFSLMMLVFSSFIYLGIFFKCFAVNTELSKNRKPHYCGVVGGYILSNKSFFLIWNSSSVIIPWSFKSPSFFSLSRLSFSLLFFELPFSFESFHLFSYQDSLEFLMNFDVDHLQKMEERTMQYLL